MIEFISAVYNEEAELHNLINHVTPWVDRINIVDDGSTDETAAILDLNFLHSGLDFHYKTIEHTGLCEVARIKALEMCKDDSWIIMLDADERFADRALEQIVDFCKSPTLATHIYFSQKEYIDGRQVADFAKVKVFKKSAAHLPEIIHHDPQFDGKAVNLGLTVLHRKTSSKQINREQEYKETYQKLLNEGKVTEDDVKWFLNMHHYVR